MSTIVLQSSVWETCSLGDQGTKQKWSIEAHNSDQHSSGSARVSEPGNIRSVNPLGMRVLVSIMKEADLSPGGLYLPEGSKQSMQESLLARVLEVASAMDHDSDEEHNISGIPLDALVLIPKHAGVRVPWDENLRIVDTKDVLALVTEVKMI